MDRRKFLSINAFYILSILFGNRHAAAETDLCRSILIEMGLSEGEIKELKKWLVESDAQLTGKKWCDALVNKKEVPPSKEKLKKLASEIEDQHQQDLTHNRFIQIAGWLFTETELAVLGSVSGSGTGSGV